MLFSFPDTYTEIEGLCVKSGPLWAPNNHGMPANFKSIRKDRHRTVRLSAFLQELNFKWKILSCEANNFKNRNIIFLCLWKTPMEIQASFPQKIQICTPERCTRPETTDGFKPALALFFPYMCPHFFPSGASLCPRNQKASDEWWWPRKIPTQNSYSDRTWKHPTCGVWTITELSDCWSAKHKPFLLEKLLPSSEGTGCLYKAG